MSKKSLCGLYTRKMTTQTYPKENYKELQKMMLSGRPITKKARQVPTLNLMLQLAPK